jgi:trehalose 6-phosphate synthase
MQRLIPAGGDFDAVPLVSKRASQHTDNVLVVIHDQNVGFHRLSSGAVNLNFSSYFHFRILSPQSHLGSRYSTLVAPDDCYAWMQRRKTPMAIDKAYFYPFEAARADSAQRLIFVTNRGPVAHSFGSDGSIRAERGAGGVVSGLLWAAEDRPISWISLAMTDADREIAENAGNSIEAPAGITELTSRLVSVSPKMYRRHYDGFSNRILWFAHHSMLRPDAVTPESHMDWAYGYRPVNESIARAVIEELDVSGDMTPVMFQDYHLYLAPMYVRERKPDACLQHFIHVPWPSVQEWEAVPIDYLHAIYRGLVANDVIGFQTQGDADRFLEGAERFLPGAAILSKPDEIFWRKRRTQVRVYPIAVTPGSLYACVESGQAQKLAAEIMRELGVSRRKLILRVDRLEPTKNIVRGFQAYEQLLSAHPSLRGQVTFLALLVPSRESLEEYQNYGREVHRTIDRINQRFGTPDWQPIKAISGNDHARALACMQYYDVLLVNPLVDGMNLVAKEGGLMNTRDGVIVLSKRAGAYAQLRDGVLGIDPEDLQATEAALYRALTIPQAERRELARQVQSTLLTEGDAGQWLARQCDDLFHYTAERRRGSITAPTIMNRPRQGGSGPEVDYRPVAKTLPLHRRRLNNSPQPPSLFPIPLDQEEQELFRD